MAIKVLLLVLVLVVCLYFANGVNRAKSQAWKKILFALFALFMAIAIALPDSTTRIANLLGVGRGADLLLYLLSLSFIFFAISTYNKFQQERARTFALARKLAIYEARMKEQHKHDTPSPRSTSR